MLNQQLQPLSREIRLTFYAMLAGSTLLLVGCIGAFLFPAASLNSVELRLSYGYQLSNYTGALGACILICVLAYIAATSIPAIAVISIKGGHRIIQQHLPEAAASLAPKALPARTWQRPTLVAPDVIIANFPDETLMEVCKRLEWNVDRLFSSQTACVVFAPFRRNVVEFHFGGGEYSNTTREGSGLIVSTYGEGFVFEKEGREDYEAFIGELSEGWNRNADVIRRAKSKADTPSTFLSMAKTGALSFFLLLAPLFASANIIDDIKAALPKSAQVVPAQGESVSFFLGDHCFGRTGDGKSTAIDLLKNAPSFNPDGRFGEVRGFQVGKNTWFVTAGSVRTKAKPLVEQAEAGIPDSLSAADRVKAADEALRRAKEEMEKSADVVSESETFRFGLYYLLLIAVGLLAVLRLLHSESLIAGSGEIIFGYSLLEMASTVKKRIAVLFSLLLIVWLFYAGYSWREKHNLWAAISVFFSPDFIKLYVLGGIGYFLVGVLSKLISDPRRDRQVNTTRAPRVFENNNRELPSGR